MGHPKGLLKWKNHFWLEEQLLRFSGGGGRSAVVVLGFAHDQYLNTLPWIKECLGVWNLWRDVFSGRSEVFSV